MFPKHVIPPKTTVDWPLVFRESYNRISTKSQQLLGEETLRDTKWSSAPQKIDLLPASASRRGPHCYHSGWKHLYIHFWGGGKIFSSGKGIMVALTKQRSFQYINIKIKKQKHVKHMLEQVFSCLPSKTVWPSALLSFIPGQTKALLCCFTFTGHLEWNVKRVHVKPATLDLIIPKRSSKMMDSTIDPNF